MPAQYSVCAPSNAACVCLQCGKMWSSSSVQCDDCAVDQQPTGPLSSGNADDIRRNQRKTTLTKYWECAFLCENFLDAPTYAVRGKAVQLWTNTLAADKLLPDSLKQYMRCRLAPETPSSFFGKLLECLQLAEQLQCDVAELSMRTNLVYDLVPNMCLHPPAILLFNVYHVRVHATLAECSCFV